MESPRKTWIAFVLAVGMLVSLSACGGDTDPNAGVYQAESVQMFGVEVSADEAFGGSPLSIELQNASRAKFSYEGKSYNMEWWLEGNHFTARGSGTELNGTLSNGILRINNMMDMGISVKLVNAELAADAPEEEAGTSGENILTNGTKIYFQNLLDVDIVGLYLSPSGSDSWGDPVNDRDIGDPLIMDISVLSDGPGSYDVGVIDANGSNYDVYDVPLDGTKLVALSAAGDGVCIILIDDAGETQTYEAYEAS